MSTAPVVVLATARNPTGARALWITRDARELSIGVGDESIYSIATRALPARTNCHLELRIDRRQWQLTGAKLPAPVTGTLERPPVVDGLFSEADLRVEADAPSMSLTTLPHDTRATFLQRAAWIVAAVCALLALLLIVWPRAPRDPGSRVLGLWRSARTSLHGSDFVVIGSLLVWWFLAPAFFDDGWVQAREEMFRSAGHFSIYYTSFASALPFGYWVEWLHHWLVVATTNLVALRIPAFACAVTLWILCRWIGSRVALAVPSIHPTSVWVLCCGFLLGAFAWSMTLRPEPLIAVLATSIAALILRFLEQESIASLALAGVLLALALPAHTTGVVAIAPLLAAAPHLFRWATAHLREFSIVFASSSALALVLLFVDSDVAQRRLDVRLTSRFSFGHQDEFTRYEFLNAVFTGTPIRRLAVGLLLLSVAAYVLRRTREHPTLLDYPTRVLIASLLLLFLTPSKWPWHFGALVGVGAVAALAETTRLRLDASRSRRLTARPFLAIGLAAAVGYWSWDVTQRWNAFDLRELSWYPNLATTLGFLALFVPALLLLGMMVSSAGDTRAARYGSAAWRVATWTVPLMTIPAVLYTVGILAIDSARAESWTLARQNIESLAGRVGCGLADDMAVPIASASQPLRRVPPEVSARVPRWVPRLPARELGTYALSSTRHASATSPWFELPTDNKFGLFVAGRASRSDRVALEWGAQSPRGVERIGAATFTKALLDEASGNVTWRYLATGELPPAPPGARFVRVSVSSSGELAPMFAISTPTRYRSVPLSAVLRNPHPTLVYPDVLPYFPCTRLPTLKNGTLEEPGYAIKSRSSFNIVDAEKIGNPFMSVERTFDVERLPIVDEGSDRGELLVFRIRNPSDATLLRAESKTASS